MPSDIVYHFLSQLLFASHQVRSIDIPLDMGSIEKELLKAGITPATSMAQKISMGASMTQHREGPKLKKQRITARTKLTNSHLPNLFDLPPPGKP